MAEDVAEKQRAEIQRLRVAAQKQLAAAKCEQDEAVAGREPQERREDGRRAAALVDQSGADAYRRAVLALLPSSEDWYVRIQPNGTISAHGLLGGPAAVQSINTSRATIVRCTSLARTMSRSLPVCLTL